jgi:hypothetical protein
MIKTNQQLGQGLLEAVIAIGILLTAIIIIISLSIASTDLGSANEMKTLATNLAREGLEVIRQQRDSNWLADVEFYKNISTGDLFTDPIIAVFNVTTNDHGIVSFAGLGLKSCYQNNPIDCACYLSGTSCTVFFNNGVYTTFIPTGVETSFRRLIFINLFESDGLPTITAGTTTTEMQVISQVYWVENGDPRNVTLETTLYDWQTNNE